VCYVITYVIITLGLVVVMLVNIESDHKFYHTGAWEMKSHNVEIYFVPICMPCVLWVCVPLVPQFGLFKCFNFLYLNNEVVLTETLSIYLIDETQHDTEI
jgi:hypothetical protein